MPTTLSDDDAYAMFLVIDTAARIARGQNPEINYLRQLLLPVYREWHGANPGKVHPPIPITRS